MGVSVLRYRNKQGGTAWGVVKEGSVSRLHIDAVDHRQLMRRFFDSRDDFMAAIGEQVGNLQDLELLSPVADDIQLFCQGLNYADHRQESGLDEGGVEEENLIFSKAGSSICGPNDDILRPIGCELLDYEIELGLVIKTEITAGALISETTLKDYVGALVLANDVSARDFMFGAPAMQWYRGKSQRTFCPLGPVLYLLDAADFAQLYKLRLQLKLNGELKQDACTDQLIHTPAKTLSDIADFADLRAGDCLLTGTPGGVLVGVNVKAAMAIVMNMRNDAKRRHKFVAAQLARNAFLQPGDQLELSIRSVDGVLDLGTQCNMIYDA